MEPHSLARNVLEAVAVVAVGVVIAFTANALRDQGLDPGRDYFPRDAAGATQGLGNVAEPTRSAAPTAAGGAPEGRASPPPAVTTILGHATADEARSGPAPTHDPVIDRLTAKGLRAIDHETFAALIASPLGQAGAYLVVDARRAAQFAEGHVPGAVHLDPFFPDAGLAAVLPLLPVAQRIVVYCNGGECDDSESAALMLQQFIPDPERVEIYTGGITAWLAAGLPIEEG